MKLNTILNKIIVVGLFAVIVLVPLVVGSTVADNPAPFNHLYSCGLCFVDTYFPYITMRNFVFRMIIELIFAVWLILAIRDRSYMPKKSWILWSFTALMGMLVLSTIASENPYKSFWSNYERMEGLVGFIHLYAYFIVASVVLAKNRLWNAFLKTSLGVSIALGVFAVGQKVGWVPAPRQGADRVDATFGNSAYFAVYLLFHTFIALYFLTKEIIARNKNIWIPIMFGFFAFLEIYFLMLTATRGTILGLFTGLFIVGVSYAFFVKGEPVLKKIGIGFLAITVASAIFLVSVRNTDFAKTNPLLSRFVPLLTLDVNKLVGGELRSRTAIWSMATRGAMERPVFGWGLESFNYLFYKYYEPKMYAQEPWFDRAHNVFFDWLVTTGIPGLLIYLSLFVGSMYYLIKKKTDQIARPEKIVIISLLIAYFVHNLTVFDSLTSYILFFTVLAYLHSVYGHEATGKFSHWIKHTIEKNKDLAFQIGAPVIAVVFVLAFYFLNVPHLVAAHRLAVAQGNLAGGLPAYIEIYKQVFDTPNFGRTEARERLAQFAIEVNKAEGLDKASKESTINFAVSELLEQIKLTPHDVRYQYFLASLLANVGKLRESLPYYEMAVKESPNKQMLLMDLGTLYINLNEYPKALEVLKKSYELDTTYEAARLQYALGAVFAGNETIQKELLLPVYGTVDLSDNRFLQAYLKTKQYARAARAVEVEVAKKPNDIPLLVTLAEVYYRSGNKTKAIEAIEKTAKIEPSLRAEADEVIKKIRAGTLE